MNCQRFPYQDVSYETLVAVSEAANIQPIEFNCYQELGESAKINLLKEAFDALVLSGNELISLGGGSITFNIASGIDALTNNTTGNNNTATGRNSLYSNTTGFQNTATGRNSLYSNTNGNNNTANGYNALYSNTTGNNNTAVGRDALSNNISFENTTGIGFNAKVTGDNQVQLGNSVTTTYAYGAVQDRSDIRDKADVRDTELGLEFVNALRPVDFKWDMREDYRPEAPVAPSENATEEEKAAYEIAKAKWLEDVKLSNITHDGSKKRSRYHHGLIAQEVKSVLDSKGIDFGGFQDHKIAGGDDVLSIGYNELIAPLIKAVQELSARVEYLESK